VFRKPGSERGWSQWAEGTRAPSLVSVVIPCYNPNAWVFEAIRSVERQTHPAWEILVVNDGTDAETGKQVLSEVRKQASERLRILDQENRGLAAARNAGFRQARGRYLVPLDADDLLAPEMMAASLAELEQHPRAAFTYSDYSVFGEKNYVERPGPYNLYRLLEGNYLTYCSCLRREAWEQAGGYDEKYRRGYEDWNFWLQLAERELFGRYIPCVLFRYRKHGRSLLTLAREHHEEIAAQIRRDHAGLYSPEGRLAVKRRWAPSLCFLVDGPPPSFENQTLQDYQVVAGASSREALAASPAGAFLKLSGNALLRPQAAEECLWGLQDADWVTWKDTGSAPPPSLRDFAGPIGVSREALSWPEPKQSAPVRQLPWSCREAGLRRGPRTAGGSSRSRLPGGSAAEAELQVEAGGSEQPSAPPPGPLAKLYRHLQNAELLSAEAWLKHPVRSAVRLIPLRAKEAVNRWAGRPVFDLSFYLQFQPRSALIAGGLVERLDYIPRLKDGRRRIALVTPHLGLGGAEAVLLEFARQIDRSRFEVLLIATQSRDSRWEARWEEACDLIYDLARIVPAERVPQAVYSMALNWSIDLMVLQNSLPAYSALPAIRAERPQMRTMDILHATDEDWDFFSATLDVAEHLDRRVVISEAGRHRLVEMNYPEENIRLIRNGVDLLRFRPELYEKGALHRRIGVPAGTNIILYAGRLDAVKRPLLLPEIARELEKMKAPGDYHFVVAGDGDEEETLRYRIESQKLGARFALLGHVPDLAPVLADADLLLIPSQGEGIPLAMLEAMAMEVPVAACRAGAIEEALPEECGVLVDAGSMEETRLAAAIRELLAGRERRRAMGRAARRLVEQHYSLDRARREYRAALDELTAEPAQEEEAS